MSERILRWILIGGMLATLFLPNSGNPNWLHVFWYLANALFVFSYSIDNILLGLGLILFTLTVPILIILNVGLAVSSSRGLEKLYRTSLLALCPLTWWGTFFSLSGGAWGIGLWANPVVVTAAALLEIAFIVWDRLWELGSEAQRKQLVAINRRIKRFGRWMLPVLLLSIICCIALAYALPRFELRTNQRRWQSVKPSEYSMVVAVFQPNSGPWRWIVHVCDDLPISIQALHEYSDNRSWLDPDNPTIEQIFTLVGQLCVDRGPNCDLEFDARFYYPKRVESPDRFVIEIEQFIPCEEAIEGCCPPHQ